MRNALTTFVFLFAAAGIAAAQGTRAQARELLAQGDEARKAGNSVEAAKFYGAGWAIIADVYWIEKNKTAAHEAFRKAQEFGYPGKPPWEKWPPKRADVEAPRRSTVKDASKGGPTYALQEDQERPDFRRFPGRRDFKDYWPYLKDTPYATGRNHAWNSLINIPALEDAGTFPAEQWLAAIGIELMSADFSDGGTQWNANLLQETIQLDYHFTEELSVGARIVIGELTEEGDDLITVVDNGAQIVPNGTRSFTLESLVVRGKVVGDFEFARWGVLAEIKIPLASDEDLLTSQTIDIGLSGILDFDLAEDWKLVINAGLVLPIGDNELFVDSRYDDMDLVIHGGAALTYMLLDSLMVGGQLEANTSPWAEVAAIDETVIGFYIVGRYQLTDSVFLGGAVGLGFGDLGSDHTVSINLSVPF